MERTFLPKLLSRGNKEKRNFVNTGQKKVRAKEKSADNKRMPEMKLSAVIITLNEEKNIGKCLESLQGVADEIVVVDSLSMDRTKEICESYGVKFIATAWRGYSDTKNYANSLASHDYLLSIDADEVLSEELRTSILKIKEEKAPKEAYILNRLTNYCGKWIRHCGWYPEPKTRIWRKELGGWTGDIHETLDFRPKSTETLKGDLLHYSFHTIAQHVNQMNKYTDLMAKRDLEKGKKASLAKVLFSPPFKFFNKYIIRLGFLDGYYGFVVCVMSAVYTFLKITKLRRLLAERE
ncbi:glycosyl transferase [Fulvitalea axinellae]|uniref:Glycosyl transferase n=1 Tax=Fulvitalea axinellae TaxID=1182444 RepID=A0AAU9CIS4_9BACT|nr:glycosyl transferase [Fulvitalea axinellae]